MAIVDGIRTWIAENILMGCQPEQLRPVLVNLGIPEEEINQELSSVATHPYLEAGRKFHDRLRKREALLKTIDEHKRKSADYLEIKKVPMPSYKDFLNDYYYQNKPGHFTGGVDHWPAMKWTFRSLVEKVGADTIVEIQQGREKDKDYEQKGFQFKKEIKFGEFIDMVENTESSNDFYLTANNHAFKQDGGLRNLLADIGNIAEGYLDPAKSEGRIFLWIGPKGIITPLHHDLTNNLFVQLVGRKTFRMIPSMQVPYMYNNHHVYSEIDLLNHNSQTHPLYNMVTPIEVEVNAGECLYIPIGWWHHVVGDTNSISLSFTNFDVPENKFNDYPSGTRY